jgi:hypothetical protein
VFFQAQPGVGFAVGEFGVAPGPFVLFVAVMGVPGGVLAHVGQVRPRLLEVVVVVGVAPGVYVLQDLPGVDAFLVGNGGLLGRVKGDGSPSGQGFVARFDVVDEHEGVLAGFVAVVPVDAFVLAQPRHEGVVAFAVLDAVFPGAVAAGQLQFEGLAVAAEDFAQDVGDGLELEDAKVALQACQPQPGAQGGAVAVVAVVLPLQAKAGDDAVDVAKAAALGLDADACALAEQGLGVDVLVFGQEVDFEFEEFAQGFVAAQLAKLQGLPQGGRDADAARHALGPPGVGGCALRLPCSP